MNDKISSSKPIGTAETAPVQPTKTVESAKIAEVSEVSATSQQSKIASVQRSTRAFTAEDRAKLFAMIDQEADQIFGPGKLPEKRKRKVTTAVKMAIDAATIDEAEDK